MRKKNSIYKRMITILLLCFLIPFIFQTIFVSGHMSRLVEEKIVKTVYKGLDNSTLLFSNTLQTQFDMVNFYKADSSVVKAASGMKDTDEKGRYALWQDMKSRLTKDNRIEQYRYPFYFMLMDYEGNLMTSYTYNPYGGYEELYEKLTESPWFLSLKNSYTDSTVMFGGEDLLSEWGTDKLYVAANVFDGDNAGILILATDASNLPSQFYELLSGASSFLLDHEGNCIAEASDTTLDYDLNLFLRARNRTKDYSQEIIEGKKSIVVLKPVAIKGYPYNWYLLSIIPLKNIMGEVSMVRVGGIVLLLVYLTAIIGTLLLLRKTIVKPIHSLCDSVNEVRKGNLQVRIEELPDNELGELGNGFNMMVQYLNRYFENVKKAEEQKRITEIRLLQNQIKPHFVRNVLNTIRWLAEINGATSVSNSILALSSLLEYNFRDSNLICTVRDEMEYVRKYIYLQELRFQNKFRDEYDMEEELLDAPILKLSFQPIVENCIYHGLLNQEGLGIISIKGRKCRNIMEFTISDNGVGMSQEKADEILRPPLLKEIYEASEATENIALWNINQRIKRQYGEAYGLSISTKPGEGTAVTMQLPFHAGEF